MILTVVWISNVWLTTHKYDTSLLSGKKIVKDLSDTSCIRCHCLELQAYLICAYVLFIDVS
jgi:hypothetical protein